jgi:hypothetical protein
MGLTMKGDQVGIWKGEAVTWFKVLSQYSSGETGKNYENNSVKISGRRQTHIQTRYSANN